MAIIFPSGTLSAPTKIVQVQQTIYHGAFSSSGNWTTVSGLNCSITPTSSSNKILVLLHIGAFAYNANTVVFDLQRNGSSVYQGASDGSRERVSVRESGRPNGDNNHAFSMHLSTVDSPGTTSSTTYSIRMTGEGRGSTMHVNREINSSNTYDPAQARAASTMTLMEFIP
jgi:hypothetical protein